MALLRIKPKQSVAPVNAPDPATPTAPTTPPATSTGDRNHAELITPAVAAERLSVTAKVLERWRGTGNGPAFVKLTRKTIRYRSEDLDTFIAEHQQASTATASAATT